jgi:FkbM family methyltransferase
MSEDILSHCRDALEDVGVFLQSSPTGDYGGKSNIMETGEIQAFQFFIRKLLYKDYDLTIFDLGCAVGEWTRMANQFVSSSKIFCFEPGKYFFEVAKKRCIEANNNQIIFDNKAISFDAGLKCLYVPKDGKLSHASLIRDNVSKLRGNSFEEIKVESTTISDVILHSEISSIDFMKIDVEGSEFEIIKSVFDAGIEENIKALQFEYNDTFLHQRISMNDFYELVTDTFIFTRICPTGLIVFPRYDPGYLEIMGMQNILLLNKKIILSRKESEKMFSTNNISLVKFKNDI